MRDGLIAGRTASINVIVTPEMFARFEGKVVHPAYSTVSMVYHMELVSRQIIVPFLEDHEEGMGGAVTVKHIAPCVEGAEVTITASVTGLQENTILTDVRAESKGRIIGVGEVKQVVLLKEKINELLTGS
ncbi:thioesterase [Mesobacillus subterraneus]|uniref:thioesterase family protein n=1 Tax=Mesobacillus subterraneus TaxID=285983 RepID=UPI001CFF0064|nr:thioesterase [Mesobacillus subterraneus]WLR57544.1 thioesterase [Mesobacillus subterraneus]